MASSEQLLVTALESAQDFWLGLPFSVLFVGHALYCTPSAPEFKDRWLVHLLLTFLWGNGGGLVTAALIMQPSVATFSFFQADYILGVWIVCWWLVNWAPGGLPAKLLEVWWVKMAAMCCTMLLRAQIIVSRVDLAVRLFPGVAAAPLILGTIAGCGGRLLADGVMTGWQVLPGLAELTSPGFVSRSAAFAAVSYYILAYATRLLPPTAAAGLVVTALMLHALAQGLTGHTLDFTAPVTHLLHTLTLVPPPPPQPTLPAPGATKRATMPSSRRVASAKKRVVDGHEEDAGDADEQQPSPPPQRQQQRKRASGALAAAAAETAVSGGSGVTTRRRAAGQMSSA